MAEIWTRATRQRQPQGAVGFNSALVQRGLRFAWVGSSPGIDILSGRYAAINAGDTRFLPSTAGITLKPDGGTTAGASFGTWQPAKTNRWTVIVLANPTASGNRQTLYSQRPPDPPFPTHGAISLAANQSSTFAASSGTLAMAMQDSPGGVFGFHSTASVIDGKFHIFAATRNAATSSAALYVDGKSVAITTTGSLATSQIDVAQETIIGRPGSYTAGGYSANCNIAAVLVFDDAALTATEIASFGADSTSLYRQLFAPERRVSYFFPASGIPTLSAATAVSIGSTTATPRVTVTF